MIPREIQLSVIFRRERAGPQSLTLSLSDDARRPVVYGTAFAGRTTQKDADPMWSGDHSHREGHWQAREPSPQIRSGWEHKSGQSQPAGLGRNRYLERVIGLNRSHDTPETSVQEFNRR